MQKPKDDPIDHGVQIHELSSWRDFVGWIDKRHSNSPALIYRGQANATWKIESTLDRLEQRFPERRNYSGGSPDYFRIPPASRDTHIRAFRQAVRTKRGINPPDLSADQWWALAQHHELATPMLDWTLSPFVALFFAFEEARCLDSSDRLCEPAKRAVFSVSSCCIDEHDSKQQPAPKTYSPRGETSYRLMNQSAVFLRMPEHTDLESYVRTSFAAETRSPTNRPPRAILEKFIMPNNDRIDCLKLLNKMNINRMSLFPDIDGAARYVNALWELNFDTSLGYLDEQLLPPTK